MNSQDSLHGHSTNLGPPVRTVPLTDATFDEYIGSSILPVLVDFWAPWCGPCKLVAPIVEEIAGEWDSRMSAASVDIDANPKIALRFNVLSVPMIVLIVDGEVVHRGVGAKPKYRLMRELEAHFN